MTYLDDYLSMYHSTMPVSQQKALDELAEMRARLSRMDRLLRDVALSAVTFQDERVGWVDVQIDRNTWVFELAHYRQNVGGE